MRSFCHRRRGMLRGGGRNTTEDDNGIACDEEDKRSRRIWKRMALRRDIELTQTRAEAGGFLYERKARIVEARRRENQERRLARR